MFSNPPDLQRAHLPSPAWLLKAEPNSCPRSATVTTNLPSFALAFPHHHVVVEAISPSRTAKAIAGPAETIAPAAQTRAEDRSNTLLNPCTMIVGVGAGVNPTHVSRSTTRTGLRCRKNNRRRGKVRGKTDARRTCTDLCRAQRRMRGRRGGRDRLVRGFGAWMDGLVGWYCGHDQQKGALAKHECHRFLGVDSPNAEPCDFHEHTYLRGTYLPGEEQCPLSRREGFITLNGKSMQPSMYV